MPESPSARGYLFAAIIIVIWTGFILVSRIGGTGSLTPFDVTAIRMGTAGLIVLPVWLASGRAPLFERRVVVLTLTGGLGYTLLVFSGFHLAPAAHAGILLSGLQPFAIALCAWMVTGERPSSQRRLGIAIIAVGAAALGYDMLAAGAGAWAGDALLAAGSACWALYTVLARHWRMSPWQVTVRVALLAALAYLPLYALALPKGIGQAGLGEIALQAGYQGVLAAVIQMVIYMRAVELLGPSRMGVLVALVPPLGALAAVPVLNEPLTPLVVASLLLVSLGVYVGNADAPLMRRIAPCRT